MKVSDYLVDFLISKGVTDIFGLPGGVILELLYSVEKRSDEIKAHLCFHEQGAGFSALGYAQVDGVLGVAYGTRGPGFTNMITAIADAYYDSVPVMFITAHASKALSKNIRTDLDQEMDTVSMVSNITKYAVRIDSEGSFAEELSKAYSLAVSERKGPVFLDIASGIWNKETENTDLYLDRNTVSDVKACIEEIEASLKNAKRPVLLLGDGVKQSKAVKETVAFAEGNNIPVLSSRFAHDIMANSSLYYGYVGSHGIRYANFILSKADLIIALGNRMAFPLNSVSYKDIIENKRIIRVDIDNCEFNRNIKGVVNFNQDVKALATWLNNKEFLYQNPKDWLTVCDYIRDKLFNTDISLPVDFISLVLKSLDAENIVVSDVGNNEFWLSRAAVLSRNTNRILYSKSFGALGCGIPKAIGACYYTKRSVILFVGDQGIQLNIQELQFISANKLPVTIILLNNNSSGMIRSRQLNKYKGNFIHTTFDSGYSNPDFEKLVTAYGISYFKVDNPNDEKIKSILTDNNLPVFLEFNFGDEYDLEPNLPIGNSIQNLVPKISEELYAELDKM